MLEKLLQHNNLGTWQQILYVVNLLSTNKYSAQDVKKFCISKEYAFSSSFEGLISLLEWIGVIKVSSLIKLNKDTDFKNNIESLCSMIFLKLAQEKQLHNFLNSNNLDFQKSIYIIKNSLIKLEFSPIRNLLINLEIFETDKLIGNQFVINKKYQKWFIHNVVPLINNSCLDDNSLEALKRRHKRNEQLGLEAEKFVLNYEIQKRIKHPEHNNIRIISEIDVNSGYDIQSYKNDNSILLDKLIEVKSYSGDPYFYWSRNEVKVAEIEKNHYFLYLVNRDEMNNIDYSPIMIQNPFESVFDNEEWSKEPQSWKFELKDNA